MIFLALAFFVLPSLICACSPSDVLSNNPNCSREIAVLDPVTKGPVSYLVVPGDKTSVLLSFLVKNYSSKPGIVCFSSDPGIVLTSENNEMCVVVPPYGSVPVKFTMRYDPSVANGRFIYYTTAFATNKIRVFVSMPGELSSFFIRIVSSSPVVVSSLLVLLAAALVYFFLL